MIVKELEKENWAKIQSMSDRDCRTLLSYMFGYMYNDKEFQEAIEYWFKTYWRPDGTR